MISLPLALTLALGAAPSFAAAIPDQKALHFEVFRDGDPVGTHDITFSDNGARVDIKTRIAVKMAFITVYRFEHDGHEQWRGDDLVALDSKTNDDGTRHQLAVKGADGELEVTGDGKTSTVPTPIVPASLWRNDIVHSDHILNTLDGRVMEVKVADMGVDRIDAGGHSVPAHHYAMTGGLQRELWYDDKGVLVKVRFRAKDDSTVEYSLR